MQFSQSFRSVAIRVTGVSAALGISFLAASVRADGLTQRELSQGATAPVAASSKAFVEVAQPLVVTTPATASLVNGLAAGRPSAGYSVAGPMPTFAPAPAFAPADPLNGLRRQSEIANDKSYRVATVTARKLVP